MRLRWLVGLMLLLNPAGALAHSGGLNASGCHTNRRTGEYDCHGAPRQIAPASIPNPAVSASPTDRPFRNCAEARAAGAAPVRRGDPGYAPRLDRDNDGIGCE